MYYMYYPYPYYPQYYHYPQAAAESYWKPRQYPEVDPSILKDSARIYHQLLTEAGKLLEKLEQDEFARQIMDAAQRGDKKEVERMIKSIDGVDNPIEVHYTPTGIRFEIAAKDYTGGVSNCCKLNLALKWGV